MKVTRKRITPKLSPHLFKTYRTSSPLTSHYRKATCQEIDCRFYREGWTFRVQDMTAQDLYMVKQLGKRYTEQHIEEGVDYLVFEPGQTCFAESQHFIPLDRPAFFFRGHGDFRLIGTHGSPDSARWERSAKEMTAEDWVDSFQNDVDKLKDVSEKHG